MPAKPKQSGKAVKKQTTNASLKKYAEPRNKTGKGGFGDRPEDRNNNGQRNKASVSFSKQLRQLIVEIGEEETTLPNGKKMSKIEGVVRAAYNEAIKGDAPARNFIAERVEGKAMQPLELTGPNGGAIQYDDISDTERIKRLLALADTARKRGS